MPYHHITNGLFTRGLLPSTTFWLSTKNEMAYKRQKAQFKETEQTLELDSHMAEMLEISDIKHLKLYDSYAKGSGGKIRQHARTDGECKQRDRNSKKELKRNYRLQKH